MQNAILNQDLHTYPAIPRPALGPGGAPLNHFDAMDYQDSMKEQRTKQNQIGELNKTVDAIVWVQCSESMRAKISGLPLFQEFCSESNVMALLQAIKWVSFNFEESVYRIDAIQEALWQLMSCRQSPYATVLKYYDAFRNSHDVLNGRSHYTFPRYIGYACYGEES
jgi:hypothetical protein